MRIIAIVRIIIETDKITAQQNKIFSVVLPHFERIDSWVFPFLLGFKTTTPYFKDYLEQPVYSSS